MARQHTPEELAEAERILKEAEPLFKERDVREQSDKERWATEIAMLERRVKDEYVEIDLGNGDMLALRTCLSEAESRKIAKLEKERTELDKDDPKGVSRLDDIALEILETVTANPLITKTWLRKNRDRYAVNDMLAASFGWYEQQVDRFRRLNSLKSFRKGDDRPELRGVPAPPGDRGSTVVRGSPAGDQNVLD